MNQKEHVLNAALLAVGIAYVLEPAGDVATFRTVAAVFVPVVLGALFPDVDVHYGKHRKALHNLPVLVVFVAYPMVFANLQWVWLGVTTHYVLDVVGSRRGIALFYPLSPREYGIPVGVSTSSRYAGLVTVLVTLVEVAVVAGALWVLGQPSVQSALVGLPVQ
ncbi:MAG: metal-dependent hydrolase [Halobacteriaceae archaeon]